MPPETPTDWRALHSDAFAGTRALVTGAAGFIGSHLAGALSQLGAEVVALDDLSAGSWDNLEACQGPLEQVEASVLDADTLTEAMRGCRWVFHQAARVSVVESWEHPEDYAQTNTIGTLNVMRAAATLGVQRVMYAGSASAYGAWDSDQPVDETTCPCATNPYAATKLAGEYMVETWARHGDLDGVVLRYFNVFGPRQRADSPYSGVIAAFTRRLLADEPVTIHGDGRQTRDFVHVDNIVHANLLAAGYPRRLDGQRINVGTGQTLSVRDLYDTLAGLAGTTAQPTFTPPRPGDIRHSRADITRANQTLNYHPHRDRTEGFQQTLTWYRQALADLPGAASISTAK